MRIVSDFRDYYDCMAQYDTDRELVFVRNKAKPVEVELESVPAFGDGDFGSSLRDWDSPCSRLIVFCGKVYPVIEVTRYRRKGGYLPRQLIYDRVAALERFGHKFWTPWWQRRETKTNHEWIRGFYDTNESNPEIASLIQQYGPVFAVFNARGPEDEKIDRRKSLIVPNVCLSGFAFAKIVPPAVAWNELWKFVCNMNQPARPIPEMSNEVKIHQAGFDPKTSFRRPSRAV